MIHSIFRWIGGPSTLYRGTARMPGTSVNRAASRIFGRGPLPPTTPLSVRSYTTTPQDKKIQEGETENRGQKGGIVFAIVLFNGLVIADAERRRRRARD